MSKDNYSLKKIYESAFKLQTEYSQEDVNKLFRQKMFSRNIDNIKSLKDLYDSPIDDNVLLNQTTPTEITGLGTFDLTPLQIGLIGCIDQYYFGDKQLALNLINVLKTGQSVKREEKSQRVRLAAGRIRENKNSDSSSVHYSLKRVKSFLNHCVKLEVLDNNLKLKTNKNIHLDKEYNVSSGLGYLFEYFVCLNLYNNKYKVNKNDMFQNKIRVSVIYVVTILKIINDQNVNENNLNSYNIFEANKADIEELYSKLDVTGNKDFFYNEIHPELDKQKLNFIFNIKHEALDVIVKYDKIITCYLDIKSSGKEIKTSKGEYYCRPDISSKKESVDKFNAITNVNNEVSKNCNIGMLNFNYVIENNKIQIRQIKSMFSGFYHVHDKIMKNKKINGYRLPYEARLTSGKTYTIDNEEKQFYFISLPRYSIDSDKAAKAVKEEMQNNFKELVIEKLIDIKNGKRIDALINLLRGKSYKEYDFTRSNTNILAKIIKDIINDSNINLSNVEDLTTIYKEMFIINNKFLENNIVQHSTSWGAEYSKERLAYSCFIRIISNNPTGNFKKPQETRNSLARQITRNISEYSSHFNTRDTESLFAILNYCKNSLDNFSKLLTDYNIPADYIVERIKVVNKYLQESIDLNALRVITIVKETIVGINELSPDEEKFLTYALKNIENYLNNISDKNRFKVNQKNILKTYSENESKLRKKIKSDLNSLQKVKTCLEGIIDFNGLQNEDKAIIEKKVFSIKHSIDLISNRIKKLNLDVTYAGEDKRVINIIYSFLEKEEEGLKYSRTTTLTRAKASFWEKIKKYSKYDLEIISTAIEKYKRTNPVDPKARAELILYTEDLLDRSMSENNSNSYYQDNQTNLTSRPAIAKNVDKNSVYIPGNVITERLFKTKLLREIYKHLF